MNISQDCVKASVIIESAIKYRSVLHGLDKLRIDVYHLYYSKYLSFISKLCVAILIVLPFFEYPSSLTLSCDVRLNISRPIAPCGILEGVESMCLLVFLGRALLMAYLFWRDEFFKNKWCIGEIIVVFISFVDLFVSTGLRCNEIYRIRRFLRPYFLISSSQMLKKTIKCLWSTLPELFSFLMLLLFWTLTATLAAMCIFSGPLKYLTQDSPWVWTNGSMTGFYETFYSLVILLTTANHPDIMLSHYNENRAAFIFFIVFLSIGTYIFMSIFTAIMYKQFKGYLSSSVQKRLFRRRVAIRAAFEVLKSHDDLYPVVRAEKILEVLNYLPLPSWKKQMIAEKLTTQYECSSLPVNTFMDLFRLLDVHSPIIENVTLRQLNNPMASRFQSFLLSRLFVGIGFIISVINVIVIAVSLVASNYQEKQRFLFLFLNIGFALFYLTEVCLCIWMLGCRTFFSLPVSFFDTFVAISNLILRFLALILVLTENWQMTINGWSPYDLGQLANLLVILRTMRCSQSYLQNGTMITTLLYLPRHLATVLGLLVSIFYCYALLGLCIFRGVIRFDQPPFNISTASSLSIYPAKRVSPYECGTYEQLNYWSLNFDDFAASLVTLWTLMVVNNWVIIDKAFTNRLGRWVHVYMLSWWLLGAVVLMTLTTAMVIESYLFVGSMRDRRASLHKARAQRRIFGWNESGNVRRCPTAASCFKSSHRQTIPSDMEEMLPAYELTHPPEEAIMEESIRDVDNHPIQNSSRNALHSFSFADMFSKQLREPTNIELVNHLQQNQEFAILLSSAQT